MGPLLRSYRNTRKHRQNQIWGLEMPKEPFGIGFLDKYLQYLDIANREDILAVYKEKKDGANAAKYLVAKEEIDLREDFKNKVKTFQMNNFWEERMLNKAHRRNIAKLVWFLIFIFFAFFFLIFNFFHKKYELPLSVFAKIETPDNYCLELSALEPVWVSIESDSTKTFIGTLSTGKTFYVFANDYIKVVLGDVSKLQVSLNGIILGLESGSRNKVKTILVNDEYFKNLDK